ncbi:hypothetical protein [Magnetospirillum sp. XM-1]|uniref:hypothetical protein n=1 Tax=Magnetospirillum sp. XM-1 TaxID=1663591 RepID=UPI0012E3A5AF|nr:hypothetical protein [Magnetospirillum sp. XM-1]
MDEDELAWLASKIVIAWSRRNGISGDNLLDLNDVITQSMCNILDPNPKKVAAARGSTPSEIRCRESLPSLVHLFFCDSCGKIFRNMASELHHKRFCSSRDEQHRQLG